MKERLYLSFCLRNWMLILDNKYLHPPHWMSFGTHQQEFKKEDGSVRCWPWQWQWSPRIARTGSKGVEWQVLMFTWKDSMSQETFSRLTLPSRTSTCHCTVYMFKQFQILFTRPPSHGSPHGILAEESCGNVFFLCKDFKPTSILRWVINLHSKTKWAAVQWLWKTLKSLRFDAEAQGICSQNFDYKSAK